MLEKGNDPVVEPVVPVTVDPIVPTDPVVPGVNTPPIVEPGKEQNLNNPVQPSWLAQLPKDLKEDAETIELLSKSQTIGDYVKATLLKQPGTLKPNEPEVDKPMVYDETFVSKLSDESDPFGLMTKSLKDTLQKNKVTAEGAKEIFETLTAAQQTSQKDFMEKGIPWCENELKKYWGNDYENQRKAVTRGTLALQQFDPTLISELDKTGATITPAVARVIAIIGNNVKEDGSIGSNNTRSGNGRNPKVPVTYPKN